MTDHVKLHLANPGISRERGISDEGLARLDKQLRAGVKISRSVLDQWIKRYGDPAISLIKKHGRNIDDLRD